MNRLNLRPRVAGRSCEPHVSDGLAALMLAAFEHCCDDWLEAV